MHGMSVHGVVHKGPVSPWHVCRAVVIVLLHVGGGGAQGPDAITRQAQEPLKHVAVWPAGHEAGTAFEQAVQIPTYPPGE